MWHVTFFALSAAISLCCLLVAVYAAKSATRRLELPQQTLRSVVSRMQSLEDWKVEMIQLQQDLANQLKMTRVRSALNHSRHKNEVPSDPDPYTQPDEWRKMMGKRLAEAKTGVKL